MKAKRLANICSIREAVFDNILELNFKLCIKDLSSILHIVKPLMWYNLDQFRYFFITTNFESEEFAIFDQRLKLCLGLNASLYYENKFTQTFRPSNILHVSTKF